MNYFQFHLNDYAEATAHLTFVEDAAYVRLLRKYYAQEGPFKDDMRAIFRLVGARTEDEREAVETVLNEYFELREGYWHHGRCDSEIAQFQSKRDQAAGAATARWEKARKADGMRTQSGRNAPASDSHADASKADADAMRSQEPITNNQEPITPRSPPAENPSGPDPNAKPETPTPGQLSAVLRKHGIESSPGDPRLVALAERGITLDAMTAACMEAVTAKPGERLKPGYVLAILQRWADQADTLAVGPRMSQGPPATPRPESKTQRYLREWKTEDDRDVIDV